MSGHSSSGGEEIDYYPGDSDMVTFERVGVPTPPFRIEQVGDDPDIRYRYEWDERGEPTPEQFERVGLLEVKLAVLSGDLDGEVEEKAMDALEAVQELKSSMCDARGLDDEQRQEVGLGNLDGLPEVSRR